MIELERFDSILSDSNIEIVDLRWGGGLEKDELKDCSLYIEVFSHKHKAIYSIKFSYEYGFRVVDEGALLKFWDCKDYDFAKIGSFAKIKNSPWKEESTIPFVYSNDKSFLIITHNECIEVITDDDPKIEFVKEVKR